MENVLKEKKVFTAFPKLFFMSMDLNSLLLLHLGKRGYEYVFIPPMAVGQLEALYYLDDKIFLLKA